MFDDSDVIWFLFLFLGNQANRTTPLGWTKLGVDQLLPSTSEVRWNMRENRTFKCGAKIPHITDRTALYTGLVWIKPSKSAPMPIYIGNKISRPKLIKLSNQGTQKLATISEDIYSWLEKNEMSIKRMINKFINKGN